MEVVSLYVLVGSVVILELARSDTAGGLWSAWLVLAANAALVLGLALQPLAARLLARCRLSRPWIRI